MQQPAAAETSYQQPVSTGNLYYYYYPVAAYPLDEKNDSDELDPLVLVLLPVTIIVGLLALLSIFSEFPTPRTDPDLLLTNSSCLDVSVTGRGRSFQSKSEVYGSMDQLKVKHFLSVQQSSFYFRLLNETPLLFYTKTSFH